MDIQELSLKQIEIVKDSIDKQEIVYGEIIFNNADCQILSQSKRQFDFIVMNGECVETFEISLQIEEEGFMLPVVNNEIKDWDRYSFASLQQLVQELALLDPKEKLEHKKYTREGMKKRVLKERADKANKADYRMKWAGNIHGDHTLINEKGVKYKIFLRDFDNETGYSDSADSALNKLGTTKHIMYAFKALNENKALFKRLSKTFPFVEIYLDPLNNYRITWHYPYQLSAEIQLLISRYFGKQTFIESSKIIGFLNFIQEAGEFDSIVIRPEVKEAVEYAYEQKMLSEINENQPVDFSLIKADLFPYQKEGIEFTSFKKATIIADEMGLGKTLQAIGAAVVKKKIFGFKHTMVVCPASIKEQWKKEIERFSDEKAEVIQGIPAEREIRYKESDCYFLIVNYETVLRDHRAINNADIDFLILDEAQRVKNYATQTARAIKNLDRKHILVITGTPIENRLIDLFSIISIIDPRFFGSLWEFSYRYCLFDTDRYNKINGYYDLQKLKGELRPILIRREKKNVIEQLPNLQEITIPVSLSPLQSDYHGNFARGVASILRKKFITPYDMQRMQILLANMRMVCNSTYLVDKETNESPKLEELKYILLNKLDVQNTNQKIIIFSEWVKMHKLIGKMLREHNIGFAELNGSVPVKARGELIRKFETDDKCKIFLSTEAGGSGLNLQVADTLINFELPWNPAKKNQRIGRIDRLGQKKNNLTVFNFITRYSIEEKIATGLMVKQNLFDGVLNESDNSNYVDFSSKGRAQFLQQLENIINDLETVPEIELEDENKDKAIISNTEKEKDDSQLTVDLSGDETGHKPETERAKQSTKIIEKTEAKIVDPKEFESVMNNGLQFISGIFKMTTGKDIGLKDQKIEIDKETGEVTLKFKMPV